MLIDTDRERESPVVGTHDFNVQVAADSDDPQKQPGDVHDDPRQHYPLPERCGN